MGVLNGDERSWIPSRTTLHEDARSHWLEICVDLAPDQLFSLIVSNNHPEGDRTSQFIIQRLDGSVPSTETAIHPSTATEIESSTETDIESSTEPESHVYPPEGWKDAEHGGRVTIERESGRTAITHHVGHWEYCVEYGMFRAPLAGLYRFELEYDPLQSAITLGALSGSRRRWLASRTEKRQTDRQRVLQLSLNLRRGQAFSLVISNDSADCTVPQRFIIAELRGSHPIDQILERQVGRRSIGQKLGDFGRALLVLADNARAPAVDCVSAIRRSIEKLVLRYRASANRSHALRSRRRGWGDRISAVADAAAGLFASNLGERVRSRVVHSDPEFHSLADAFHTSKQQVAELSRVLEQQRQELAKLHDLRDLSEFQKFLRDQRPDNWHLNGCGDFQLMAREHWHDLRGYPEFQTFSMNIDGLLSCMAHAAGIAEQILAMPIYHLEHEVGSGWSPEGEALLRRRIAERGITWLDASTVHIWASYMRWLQRPVLFNDSNWGFGDVALPDSVHSAIAGAAPHHVRDRR
jgi:hypothetical protein